MEIGTLGLMALLLVCPVAMLLMMRGGGHGSAGSSSHEHSRDHMSGMSDEQLRELADRAERELKDREAAGIPPMGH